MEERGTVGTDAPLTRLAAISDIPDEEGLQVLVDGIEPIAVFRVGEEIFVTQDTCSHARASLCSGWLEGHEVCCPVHTGRFDLRTGAALCFPASEPLRTFRPEIRGGEVWADLSGARPEGGAITTGQEQP